MQYKTTSTLLFTPHVHNLYLEPSKCLDFMLLLGHVKRQMVNTTFFLLYSPSHPHVLVELVRAPQDKLQDFTLS